MKISIRYEDVNKILPKLGIHSGGGYVMGQKKLKYHFVGGTGNTI